MYAPILLPLLLAGQPLFEDLSALDQRLAEMSGNRAIPLDKRLRLARCPSPAQIESGPQGSLAIRCIPAGWQLRVALSGARETADPSERSSLPIVHRGETVHVAIVGNDFTLSYSGVATEAGRKGDPVRVRFPTSGNVLVATVSGPGKVMIED